MPIDFRGSSPLEDVRSVEDVGEIFEEVYPVEPAGTCQGVKDASPFCPGVAAEEEGVSS